MNLTIAQILEATNGKLLRGDVTSTVTRIATDSRTLMGGDLFVALIGEKFDGHDFLDQVRQKGAIGAVISRQAPVDLPIAIQVKDTLTALGDMAMCHRRKFNLPIVTITGSNGKTTTKDMAAAVLCQRFSVFKSEKSYNNQIGIPLRLLQLTDAAEIAVLEIGTSWPGEIERLSQIIAPTVGVITNIGTTHLELLGSIEGVAKEKGALLGHVEHAILNADDPMTPTLAGRVRGHITTFGWRNDADVSANDIEVGADGRPAFTLYIGKRDVGTIRLRCLGKHNISNALAAACIGVWSGLTPAAIRVGLESYRAAEMRMRPIELNGLQLINDAYNSNPDSLQSALECFTNLETSGKRIAVLGDMLELGVHSPSLHFNAGRNIPPRIDLLITVGLRSREIARGAKAKVRCIIPCDTPEAAAQKLSQYAHPGDAVLIKGSRGMKLERIVEALR